MSNLTDEIHSLLDLDKKLKEILTVCQPHLDMMWASKIVGIILDCDFRDAETELRKLCE